jgi:very-short-patch-repair endonuclease
MEFFICTQCNKEFNEINSLRKHNVLLHKINAEASYSIHVLKGEPKPTCKCGCGLTPKFISIQKGYRPFVNGHNNNIKGGNNFHKNPDTKIKSAKTQSDNWAKGMYRRWWEEDTEETRSKIESIKEHLRNDKERGEKISQSLTGHKVAVETKNKISDKARKRYEERPELGIAQSKRRLKWMRDNSKIKTSKLETKFADMLLSLGFIKDVDFIHNHLVENIKTFFDFYLPKHNILIECDGNFYHCHPNTHPEAVYEIQKKNVINDKRKNTWAENHEIRLLRYWESDINERPEWVLEDLKKKLGL